MTLDDIRRWSAPDFKATESGEEMPLALEVIRFLLTELDLRVGEYTQMFDALHLAQTKASQWNKEILAILNATPGAIRVHEGGGPENLLASIAVTVSALHTELDKENLIRGRTIVENVRLLNDLAETKRQLEHAVAHNRIENARWLKIHKEDNDQIVGLGAEREALRKRLDGLVFVGEHQFPDLTWKARCEEVVAEREEWKRAHGALEQAQAYWRNRAIAAESRLSPLAFRQDDNENNRQNTESAGPITPVELGHPTPQGQSQNEKQGQEKQDGLNNSVGHAGHDRHEGEPTP